jgi:acyl-CoA thioester hydrolase
MLQFDFQKRVRYSETDQMGYVYYGNYATYYEIGRVETMRNMGFPYSRLEQDYKIMMPVMQMNVRFLRPAKYDDMLTIRTILKTLPDFRVTFHGEIYNEAGALLNVGEVKLAFVDMTTFKSCPPPPELITALQPFFEG